MIKNYKIITNYGAFYLKDIINDILNLLEKYKDQILNIFLFGSYSRGDFNENSDIDFFVVSEDKDEKFLDKKLCDLELDLLFKYGIEINFILENKNNFDNKTNYFLIKNVEKDGIKLWGI